MGINGVSSNSHSAYPAETVSFKSSSIEASKTAGAQSGTAAAENADKNISADGDKLEKSNAYKTDFDKVAAMKQTMWSKVDTLEKMVNALFQKQGLAYNASLGMKANLENLIAGGGVSEEERIAAEEAIGEDGEWGVEKTAQRILDFAKAISGGDPSKIETLRQAVEKGFSETEKIWGGSLPDICSKTYERVMAGFDDWAKSGETEGKAETE